MPLSYSLYILEKEKTKWTEKLKHASENGLSKEIEESVSKRIKARINDLEKGIKLINEHLS